MILSWTIIAHRSSLPWRMDGDIKNNSYCIVSTVRTLSVSKRMAVMLLYFYTDFFYEHVFFEEIYEVFFYSKSLTFSLEAPHKKIKLNNSYSTFVLKVYHSMKLSVCSPNELKLSCQHS